jgi:hypothetical protein
MKRMALGAMVALGLLLALSLAMTPPSEALGQRAGALAPAASNDLVVAAATVSDKTQLLTILDPQQRVLGVYAVDLASGKITLRSVRNISWDLQMTYHNNEHPLPQEIRALLEQK